MARREPIDVKNLRLSITKIGLIQQEQLQQFQQYQQHSHTDESYLPPTTTYRSSTDTNSISNNNYNNNNSNTNANGSTIPISKDLPFLPKQSSPSHQHTTSPQSLHVVDMPQPFLRSSSIQRTKHDRCTTMVSASPTQKHRPLEFVRMHSIPSSPLESANQLAGQSPKHHQPGIVDLAKVWSTPQSLQQQYVQEDSQVKMILLERQDSLTKQSSIRRDSLTKSRTNSPTKRKLLLKNHQEGSEENDDDNDFDAPTVKKTTLVLHRADEEVTPQSDVTTETKTIPKKLPKIGLMKEMSLEKGQSLLLSSGNTSIVRKDNKKHEGGGIEDTMKTIRGEYLILSGCIQEQKQGSIMKMMSLTKRHQSEDRLMKTNQTRNSMDLSDTVDIYRKTVNKLIGDRRELRIKNNRSVFAAAAVASNSARFGNTEYPAGVSSRNIGKEGGILGQQQHQQQQVITTPQSVRDILRAVKANLKANPAGVFSRNPSFRQLAEDSTRIIKENNHSSRSIRVLEQEKQQYKKEKEGNQNQEGHQELDQVSQLKLQDTLKDQIYATKSSIRLQQQQSNAQWQQEQQELQQQQQQQTSKRNFIHEESAKLFAEMNSAFLLRINHNTQQHLNDKEAQTGNAITAITTSTATPKTGDISIEIGETIDKILLIDKNDGGADRKRFASRSVSPTVKEIYAAQHGRSNLNAKKIPNTLTHKQVSLMELKNTYHMNSQAKKETQRIQELCKNLIDKGLIIGEQSVGMLSNKLKLQSYFMNRKIPDETKQKTYSKLVEEFDVVELKHPIQHAKEITQMLSLFYPFYFAEHIKRQQQQQQQLALLQKQRMRQSQCFLPQFTPESLLRQNSKGDKQQQQQQQQQLQLHPSNPSMAAAFRKISFVTTLLRDHKSKQMNNRSSKQNIERQVTYAIGGEDMN